MIFYLKLEEWLDTESGNLENRLDISLAIILGFVKTPLRILEIKMSTVACALYIMLKV